MFFCIVIRIYGIYTYIYLDIYTAVFCKKFFYFILFYIIINSSSMVMEIVSKNIQKNPNSFNLVSKIVIFYFYTLNNVG